MFTYFAAETEAAASGGLLGALGIDVKLLVTQAIAFLVLVALLRKFVYPHLVRAIDDRRAAIEKGLQDAKASEESLAKAEKRIQKLLSEARTEADGIIARSHAEATAQVADAEEKSKKRAEQIIADAHKQLEADITKARQALKKDTAELVAIATERIIHEKVDSRKDAELIDRALTVSGGGRG